MALHLNITFVIPLLLAMALPLFAMPALAQPVPPNIDWKQLEDLLEEDTDSIVGEEMC